MQKLKTSIALLTLFLMLLATLPTAAFAAEKIDIEHNVDLTIIYKTGETALSGAQFNLYRVADIDADAQMTVTEDFQPFSVVLDDLDQEGWQALAVRLKGEAQSKLSPMASGTVDETGHAVLSLKPGLYLAIPGPIDKEDTLYVSDPFMVFLPGRDLADRWMYSVTVTPKNTHASPIYKVIKVWDPAYESAWKDIDEIQLDILCDGVYDRTIALTKANNWTYAFSDELDPKHDWSFAEHKVDDFTPQYEIVGTTLKITNHYTPIAPLDDMPIEKKVKGSPSEKAQFTFVLQAKEADNPMPVGSKDGVKEIKITGAGVGQFGKISFEQPGDYQYTVREKNEGLKGYTYDATVYTVTFHVTESDDGLSAEASIVNDKGELLKALVFTNKYTQDKLPQTGLLWWPVPTLLSAGLLLLLVGIVRRKGSRNEE